MPLRGHHADAQSLDAARRGEMDVRVGDVFRPRKLRTDLDHMTRRAAGKRSYTVTVRKRGRYTYARPADGSYDDLAIDATLRRAAPFQVSREQGETAIRIADDDLQRKVRVRKAANLILFAVDASWSMAAAERMEATKGAIMSLLVDAYQKRDLVAMISFQKEQAHLVLPPTSNVDMAKVALQDLPVGGKTPLSAALLLGYQVISREKRRDREIMPLFIVLTDGAGNVSMTGMPPHEEGLLVADLFAQDHIRALVINTEHEALDRGLAQELAHALHAPCYALGDLRADVLYETVRRELGQG